MELCSSYNYPKILPWILSKGSYIIFYKYEPVTANWDGLVGALYISVGVCGAPEEVETRSLFGAGVCRS